MAARSRKKRKLELLEKSKSFTNIRIAILCGSSIGELPDYLELNLLEKGLKPDFFIGGYNRCYEDAVYNNELLAFSPDIIYFHTTCHNILNFPEMSDTTDRVLEKLEIETDRLYRLWDICAERHSCIIIQNNFDPPFERALGSLEFSDIRGRVNFINLLNAKVCEYANSRGGFLVQDIAWLAAKSGLSNWHDPKFMYLYKYAVSVKCIPVLANSLSSLIASTMGKRKKCVVLDLDDTLWGGIVGDDGVSGIIAGNGSPAGEAYLAFQKYLKRLSDTGILLAVASKNEENVAKNAFEAEGMFLRLEDFASFHANWDAKHENITRIAKELNLGLDSIVFIDDNPAERELVASFLPDVWTPDGNGPLDFMRLMSDSFFFEAASISDDDVRRARMYRENRSRLTSSAKFGNYDDYLRSLIMSCRFTPIGKSNAGRASSLINKTNQFNLTAHRTTETAIVKISKSPDWITLCGQLYDKFGDNGIVTVLAGRIENDTLEITFWVMSCRVFKRHLEYAVFDEVVRICAEKSISRIIGIYKATSKNTPFKELYKMLGFTHLSCEESISKWEYIVPKSYENKSDVIEIIREEKNEHN